MILNNCHVILLTSFMGNTRQSTGGMAYLCPTIHGVSRGKTPTVIVLTFRLCHSCICCLALDDRSLLHVNWPSHSIMAQFLEGVLLEECSANKPSRRPGWKLHALVGPSLRSHIASLLLSIIRQIGHNPSFQWKECQIFLRPCFK